MKAFRIVPEFRILRLTFCGKSASKSWIWQILIVSLVTIFSVYLKTIDYLKLEIVDIYRHTANFKIWFSKVQDFGNFELSPVFSLNSHLCWYTWIDHNYRKCSKFLNARCPTKMPRQAALTQIRLLLGSSLIRVFPVCYSDMHFINSSPESQQFVREKEGKSFRILEHLCFSAVNLFCSFFLGYCLMTGSANLCVWLDSLRPINNLLFIKGWVFLGWTSTKLG